MSVKVAKGSEEESEAPGSGRTRHSLASGSHFQVRSHWRHFAKLPFALPYLLTVGFSVSRSMCLHCLCCVVVVDAAAGACTSCVSAPLRKGDWRTARCDRLSDIAMR